ncbi:hypothetical protein [Peribacillus alkalitolerans]|uniref:hypothetical protein n=1 Tax=Peribacillus alkalitolerans TaxID=1550385 RepID=UPI0013D5154E|nr:hypothetical protein [Peribacillus alkalitolerans]
MIKWICFLKDGNVPIYIHFDNESLISLSDTDKHLEDINIAMPDTYDNSTHRPKQIKEVFIVLTNEQAATYQGNV